MQAIKGKYRDGKIILAEKADWPEDTEVLVEPVAPTIGMREEDWPTDAEGIAALIARMEKIEPLLMTPEEEAEWHAALKAQKDYELATWEERAKKIEGLFP